MAVNRNFRTCPTTGLVFHEPAEIGNARHLGEASFVEARLKAIFQRHHQLDALQRAQAQLVEGRRSAHRAAVRESREQRLE